LVQVDMPLGSDNPDWPVVMEIDGRQRLFFVDQSRSSFRPPCASRRPPHSPASFKSTLLEGRRKSVAIG